MREYLLKGVIQNAVNVPSISEEEYQVMRPYIALGERLGAFLAQSGEGGVEEMGLSYSGEIAEWKTALIRNAAVAGALNQTGPRSRAGEPGERCFRCRGAGHPPDRAQASRAMPAVLRPMCCA